LLENNYIIITRSENIFRTEEWFLDEIFVLCIHFIVTYSVNKSHSW